MEFVVDWNAVCLVCLQEGEMRSIYEKDEKDMSYCDKIMRCSNIEIKRGMNLPEQICTPCVKDLNAAFRFRTNCESSNVILKSFIDSRVTDLEIPAPNGQVYKYKPPSGLNVKRIQCTPKFKVKEEQIIEEITEDYQANEENYNVDSYEIHEDVFHDDDSNQPLSSIKSEVKKIKFDESEVILESSDDPSLVIQDKVKKEENGAVQSPVKVKSGKRGRPKGRIHRPKLDTEVTPDNISSMVTHLTSIAYIKKVPEDEKPLKICEICGNGYKYQHALDSHMRRHRNEKPFSCEFCDRAFVANVELRRHMRVHTGQKPYACRYCDRRFSDFGSRIKHERTHTGERPYKCSTCGKAFAYAHVLSVHVLTHTGEKRFKCHVCGKGFTKKVYLQSHMSHHSVIQASNSNEQHIEIQENEQTESQIMFVKEESESAITAIVEQDVDISIEDYKDYKPITFSTNT